MELNEKPAIVLPDDMDDECIALCNLLNRIPGVRTSESCCGHGKSLFRLWFRCTVITVIARLARCVDRNYSDGFWEVVAENADGEPVGFFCLRTKKPCSGHELEKSLGFLAESIEWWFGDDFDEYFSIH